MTTEYIDIIIPFQGFYGTVHELELDSQLETYLEENDIDTDQCEIDWKSIREEYAKNYVEQLSHVIGGSFSDLQYSSISSPREYNFENDKILGKISKKELNRLHNSLIPHKDYQRYIHEELKPSSGFIPCYDNDVLTWGALDSWDLAQRSSLLQYFFNIFLDYEGIAELDILEDYFCNGGRSLVEEHAQITNI